MLQGGLGMPDRDYYVQPGARMEGNRSAYRAHIAAMLKLAGIADPDAKAGRIFDLERRIAGVHATRTESADMAKGNNPWMREDFSRRAPGLDWPALFQGARISIRRRRSSCGTPARRPASRHWRTACRSRHGAST